MKPLHKTLEINNFKSISISIRNHTLVGNVGTIFGNTILVKVF